MTRLTPLALLSPLALSLALIGQAQAQSLVELYESARGYDAAYLGARALAQSAGHKAAQSDALKRPSASLTAGHTQTEADTPIGRRDTTATQVLVNARYSLFNRVNDRTLAQAAKSLDAARADVDVAEQDLILRVTQTYFDVLAAQDTLETTRASKTAITEQLASAKRNFEVGTATITDSREAQARFDLATATEIAADNDLRTKRIALDQLVGRVNVTPKRLAQPVALPVLLPANVDTWVTQAENQHPLVRKAQVGLDIASLEIERAKAGHLPSVDLIGNLGSTHSTGSAILVKGTTTSASIGVQLTMPLYSGNAIESRVKETLSLREKSMNDLDVSRRGVAQLTRQAFFGVLSGQAQVKALEAAEGSSKLALEATQLGYRVGVRVNLDVLNAQTQLFQTQRDLAKARYDVLVGGLRLRLASGQLSGSDLQVVNTLLAK